MQPAEIRRKREEAERAAAREAERIKAERDIQEAAEKAKKNAEKKAAEKARKEQLQQRKMVNKEIRKRAEEANEDWHMRHGRVVLTRPIFTVEEHIRGGTPLSGNHYGLQLHEAVLLGKLPLLKKNNLTQNFKNEERCSP